MADDWQLALLNEQVDGARVLDCAQRCRDYVMMEAGREPDALWVTGFFNDIPPERTKDDILMLGIERPDGSLIGLLGMSPGYETQTEWYIGLLVVTENERGAGIGARVVSEVINLAKASGAQTLRLSVFGRNPDALRFWEANGFYQDRVVGDDLVLVRQI